MPIPAGASPAPLVWPRPTDGAMGEAAAPTIVGICGVPITVQGSISWGYVTGETSQSLDIPLHYSLVDQIQQASTEAGGEVTLYMAGPSVVARVGAPDRFRRTFTRLALLPPVQVSNTHYNLRVRDQRILWSRNQFSGAFNITSAANDKFVKDVNRGVLQGGLGLAALKGYFAPAFLKQKPTVTGSGTAITGGKLDVVGDPWTALEIALHILEHGLGYQPSEIIKRHGIPATQYIPPNEVFVGERADQALARMLALAECTLYIDEDGKCVIYSTATGVASNSEEKRTQLVLNRLAVSGRVRILNKKTVRPHNYFVGFQREPEVLLSYQESAAGANQLVATTLQAAKTQIGSRHIFVENVTTTVTEDQGLPGVPRGAVVTIQQALAGFGSRFGNGPISLSTLREKYGAQALAPLGKVIGAPTTIDPTAVMAWQAIMRDYRTMYRIPRLVLDYIKSIAPVRANMLFPESGTRGPSEVFARVTWLVRAIAYHTGALKTGIPLDSRASGLANYAPAPYDLGGIDVETGVFRITARDNLWAPGHVTGTIPGYLTPTAKLQMLEDQWGKNQLPSDTPFAWASHSPLDADFYMDAVVSMIPHQADSSDFHWVSWTDVRLGANEEPPGGEGVGDAYNYISHDDTARTAYSDAKYSYPGAPTGVVNQEILLAIARNEMIRLARPYHDQLVGRVRCLWEAAITVVRPSGQVSDVLYTVAESGACYLDVSYAEHLPPVALVNLLPRNVLESAYRQIAVAEVNQGGGQK